MKIRFNRYKILFLFVVLTALFLMSYKADKRGIWSDDKASLNSALGIKDGRGTNIKLPDDDIIIEKDIFTPGDYWIKNNLKNVIRATVRNNGGNGLFYNVILHYWAGFFGVSDLALRFLSIIFGLLTIVFSYHFTNLITGSERVSVFTAALTAIHPLLIYYCQEVRMYSLGILMALISSWVLIKILQSKKTGRHVFGLFAAYTLGWLVSLFSHYYTIYILLGHFVFICFMTKGKEIRGYFSMALVIICAVFSAWWLTWGWQGYKLMYALNEGIKESVSRGATTSLSSLIAGWVQVSLSMSGNYFQWLGFRIRELAVLLFIPLFIIALCFNLLIKKYGRAYIFFLMLLIIVSPVFSTLNSIKSGHTVFFSPRYAVFSIPYAMALLGIAVSCIFWLSRPKKIILLSLAVLQVLIMTASINVTYADIYKVYGIGGRPPRMPNPYISLSRDIKKLYRNMDVVIYPAWEDAQLTSVYLKGRDDILQKVDTRIGDKVFLKQAETGAKIELFDFKGRKYRY